MVLSEIARRAGVRFGILEADPVGSDADRLFGEFDVRADQARIERQSPSPEAERVVGRALSAHHRQLNADDVEADIAHFEQS